MSSAKGEVWVFQFCHQMNAPGSQFDSPHRQPNTLGASTRVSNRPPGVSAVVSAVTRAERCLGFSRQVDLSCFFQYVNEPWDTLNLAHNHTCGYRRTLATLHPFLHSTLFGSDLQIKTSLPAKGCFSHHSLGELGPASLQATLAF